MNYTTCKHVDAMKFSGCSDILELLEVWVKNFRHETEITIKQKAKGTKLCECNNKELLIQ
jgi:hypothetical protein